MDNQEILRRRLHNQHLTRPETSDPAAEVSWFGAMQSQDYGNAKWALGQRVRGATNAGIEQAFNAGEILRTHVLRPTWHFVARADIRWLLALSGPRVHAVNAYYYRMNGLDAALFKRINAALASALRGGNFLTRAELVHVLNKAGIERKGLGLAYVVSHAELDGLICSGPRRGKQHTYALLEERAPHAKMLAPDVALAELTKRYFTSHGPAMVKDYVWWSGLTAADAKRGLEIVGAELAQETVEGKEFWFKDVPPRPASRAAHLLPNLDEYTVAYKERGAYYPSEQIANPNARENEPLNHVILMHGRIAGMWKPTLKKDSLLISSRFISAPAPEDYETFRKAATRLGKFRGLPVSVE